VGGVPGDPTVLEEVVPRALVRPVATVGEVVSVAWEVNGLGWAPEEVAYELSVERSGVGLFRRLGQAVGLVDPVRPLSLAWTEPGPPRPEPVLRLVALELGDVESGVYRVTLRARVAGRGVLTSRATIRLQEAQVDDEGRVF